MTDNYREGIRLFHEGRTDQAILFLGEVDPDELISASYYLALCHTKGQRYEKSLECLELVMAGEGNFLKVLQAKILKGWLLTRMNKTQDALGWFELLINEGIESAQVYSAYGWLLAQNEKKKEAVNFLNQALLMDPENANTMNTLGYILAEMGILLEKALKLCRQALSKDPDNSLYLDSLAWVYYQMGQYRLAKISAVKALGKVRHPLIEFHLKKIEEKLSSQGARL